MLPPAGSRRSSWPCWSAWCSCSWTRTTCRTATQWCPSSSSQSSTCEDPAACRLCHSGTRLWRLEVAAKPWGLPACPAHTHDVHRTCCRVSAAAPTPAPALLTFAAAWWPRSRTLPSLSTRCPCGGSRRRRSLCEHAWPCGFVFGVRCSCREMGGVLTPRSHSSTSCTPNRLLCPPPPCSAVLPGALHWSPLCLACPGCWQKRGCIRQCGRALVRDPLLAPLSRFAPDGDAPSLKLCVHASPTSPAQLQLPQMGLDLLGLFRRGLEHQLPAAVILGRHGGNQLLQVRRGAVAGCWGWEKFRNRSGCQQRSAGPTCEHSTQRRCFPPLPRCSFTLGLALAAAIRHLAATMAIHVSFGSAVHAAGLALPVLPPRPPMCFLLCLPSV